jgi:hypothetical protein
MYYSKTVKVSCSVAFRLVMPGVPMTKRCSCLPNQTVAVSVHLSKLLQKKF